MKGQRFFDGPPLEKKAPSVSEGVIAVPLAREARSEKRGDY